MAKGTVAKAAQDSQQPGQFAEIGVSGFKIAGGIPFEEFLPQLDGERGRRKFREMAENDPTVGSVLFAIGNILRAVKWQAQPSPDAPEAEAKAEAEFAESILDDMSHTWEDFIAEALTMLVYGWSYFEIVLKRRIGPLETDPQKRSKFSDGRIGIRKLAPRSQDSLSKWEMQDDGGIAGLWQIPPLPTPGKPGQIFIPIERALLLRTTSRKNSPEGISVLRTAYRPWFYLTRIQEIEAIGIERELAGLPVVRIPNSLLASEAAADQAIVETYKKIARDVKRNEQGGVVIPSDPFLDADGNPTSVKRVDIELLTSGGTRAIDTDKTVRRYQADIARAVLAEFIMLGSDSKGSFALSKDKTSMFSRACETFLNQIAAAVNRFLLPRIWDYNGLDRATMPSMKPGRVSPIDLGELGTFIESMSRSGATLFPDDNLENYLRDEADLPEKSQEAMDLQAAEREQQAANAAAAAEALAQGKQKQPGGQEPPPV